MMPCVTSQELYFDMTTPKALLSNGDLLLKFEVRLSACVGERSVLADACHVTLVVGVERQHVF